MHELSLQEFTTSLAAAVLYSKLGSTLTVDLLGRFNQRPFNCMYCTSFWFSQLAAGLIYGPSLYFILIGVFIWLISLRLDINIS